MPPMTTATYYGVKALIGMDFADDPEALRRVTLRLDQKRAQSFTEAGLCQCGRALLPRQSGYCSPQCANEEALRDDAVRQATNEATKARWAAEDAAAAASKENIS